MDFVDRELKCGGCGSTFVFSADEQQFFRNKGFTHDPKRCKAQREGETSRTIEAHFICADCGKEGDGADEKSWGVGAIWWDAKVPGFRIVWCDSFALDAGCRLLSEPGKWEGDAFVATDVHEVSGRPVFEKEVWSDFTPDSFSQTLYVGDARDTLKRFMTIKAKRVTKP